MAVAGLPKSLSKKLVEKACHTSSPPFATIASHLSLPSDIFFLQSKMHRSVFLALVGVLSFPGLVAASTTLAVCNANNCLRGEPPEEEQEAYSCPQHSHARGLTGNSRSRHGCPKQIGHHCLFVVFLDHSHPSYNVSLLTWTKCLSS
jgi:hypothetical protein